MAVHWLRRSAQAGYAKAQYQLSRILAKGRDLPADADAARHWLAAAAVGGHAGAQYQLARCYLRSGDADSQRTALAWFTRAAGSGHAPSMYCVGVCHLKGVGVTSNTIDAYHWFLRAAARGSHRASDALTRLERKLAPAELARARSAANRPAL